MNIPSALSVAQITLYLAAVAAVVSALVTQFVQPLVNRVSALAPTAPDPTLRNLVLRGANLVLSVVGVLGLAAVAGQLSLANAIPTVVAVVMVTLGAHSFYKLIPVPSAPPAPPAPSTNALSSVMLPTVTVGASPNGGAFVASTDGPLPVAPTASAPAIGGPANIVKQPA